MIKLFATDMDGVLTDGTYAISSHSGPYIEVVAKFHTRDWHGMQELHKKGVKILILTSNDGHIAKNQIQRTCSEYSLIHSTKDKLKSLKAFAKNLNIELEDIAYIGDDVGDISVLEKVGVAACPADADEAIIDVVNDAQYGIVLTKNGGCGCVRELINIILRV